MRISLLNFEKNMYLFGVQIECVRHFSIEFIAPCSVLFYSDLLFWVCLPIKKLCAITFPSWKGNKAQYHCCLDNVPV